MLDSLFLKETPAAYRTEDGQERLRAELPHLRTLPGCPRGDDEDILQMSLAPAYTACPNPFIEEWLRESAPAGYEQREYVDPGPFTADVSEGKSHPVYKAHSFHTKVPHQVIMRYLLHYTQPGDVVLDGFCGTGMTGVAAQACAAPDADFRGEIETQQGSPRWGARRAILQDLSPAATFIAAGLNLPMDPEAFDRRSRQILDEFDAEWGWMYETTHRDGRKARIDYTVWSEVFTCPFCGGAVVFYDAASGADEDVANRFRCPNCGAEVTKQRLERRLVATQTLAGDIVNRAEFRPMAIHYRLARQEFSKKPDDADLDVLRRIARTRASWFPTDQMPVDRLWHGYNFKPRGLTHVHHLWSDRALLSLSVIWDKCSREADPALRASLLFWAEQALWSLSWMNRFRPRGYSQASQYMTGVYYFPALSAECSPRYYLEGSQPSRGKRQNLASLWRKYKPGGNVRIATGSSAKLLIPDHSVDYVFVDPPFGLNIPYTDLNLPTEFWHKVVADPSEEAVVHRVRGVTLDDYQRLIGGCFAEFYRVLKPNRWMTVEFSNSSNAVWLALQEAMSRAGFVVADTRILDEEHHSWIQVRRPNAVKHDIIISAYRPAEQLEQRFALVAGTEEGAWAFIREHLAHLPVTEGKRGQAQVIRERQEDRLYDRMVAYHVHRGAIVPLTTGEFYAGLEQRFPLRDTMYFLPEQVERYERHRLTVKELIQAELFITGEASAVQWLRQRLKAKPQAFADIQPPFFDELQAGLPDWEDLPDLRQLLDESFLQDERGRWFVPDPRNAVHLEELRMKALLKEFGAYLGSSAPLKRFRSEAVRAGFKDAWGRRDFPMIVSVGNRLPESVFEEEEALLHYYKNAQRLVG